MRGRPVEPQTVEQIIALHAEGLGRNEIARRTGVSFATVTAYCQEHGLTFDTSKSALAVAIQTVNLDQARKDLAAAMVLRAQESLEAFDAPATIVHYQPATDTTNGGFREHVLEVPTFADQQRIMTMAAIAFDKATRLTERGGGANEATIGLLDTFGDALREAADKLREETPLRSVDGAEDNEPPQPAP